MSIHQPTKPMDTTPRDPHLPPPAVCDWLLEQKWSERIPSIEMTFSEGGAFGSSRSALNGYHEADMAIGRDETALLFMPHEALDVLRKDQDDRRAALEQKRQASEAERLANTATRWSQDAADRVRESCRRL